MQQALAQKSADESEIFVSTNGVERNALEIVTACFAQIQRIVFPRLQFKMELKLAPGWKIGHASLFCTCFAHTDRPKDVDAGSLPVKVI